MSGNAKDNSSDNEQALQDAASLAHSTQEVVRRIQQKASETTELGTMTLEQLYEQRLTLDRALQGADRMNEQLDVTEKLQNRFARWALKFNSRRVARQDAKSELRTEKQRKELREIRALRNSAKEEESEQTLITKEMSTKGKRSRKSKGIKSAEAPVDHTKGILYGVKNDDEEYKDKLDQLAMTDAEIDESLNMVGVQLEGILSVAKAMNEAAQSQSPALDEMEAQLVKADYKQKVVNHRARRFLTGKVRKKYEKPFALASSAAS